MAKIHLNKDDIKSIVESYKKVNDTFVIRSFIDLDNKKTCSFFINGKECKIIAYIKKKSINIIPSGNNIDECNLLINYICSKGFSTDIEVKQFTFPCTKNTIDLLITYVEEECVGIVNCIKLDNIYKFIGYNCDELTLTFYPQISKAMIQGRPFHAFNIIVTFLSGLSDYSFDQIVNINNAFANKNTPSSSIRNEMERKLEDSYSYLDEALLKSISGSLTLLKQKTSSEDYTGCVTGDFKALEGYLLKILVQKYNYKINKKNKFKMFYKNNGQSQIDIDRRISRSEKDELNKLYSIYSNKRNVYLHSTIDPSQTRIITTLKEAKELSDHILNAIKESYLVIFA